MKKLKVDECIGSTQKHSARTDGTYSPTLTEATGKGGGHVPMVKLSEEKEDNRKIKIEGNLSNTNHHGKNVYSDKGLSPTLCGQSVYKNGLNIKQETDKEQFRIRKLTPIECERLQAFPDNWTELGKDGEKISNTQRYKCLGNAVTTSVVTFLVNEMFSKLTETEEGERKK